MKMPKPPAPDLQNASRGAPSTWPSALCSNCRLNGVCGLYGERLVAQRDVIGGHELLVLPFAAAAAGSSQSAAHPWRARRCCPRHSRAACQSRRDAGSSPTAPQPIGLAEAFADVILAAPCRSRAAARSTRCAARATNTNSPRPDPSRAARAARTYRGRGCSAPALAGKRAACRITIPCGVWPSPQ